MADPNSFVYIAAQIKPAQGKAEELLENLVKYAKVIEENEPGCVSWQFFFSKEDYEIEILEIYKDAAAVQAHKDSAHYATATDESMKEKLAAPAKIQILERKGGFRRG